MDLRPQAHEIIRTWLFSTVLRAHQESDALPWSDAAISGWVLDPDRKKMSKSKGNVVTPMHLLEQYGADAVRYWSTAARPGTDTAFDEGQMKIGRRLSIKLLNASRFALGLSTDEVPPGPRAGHDVAAPLDRAMLAQLADLVDEATAAFESYDYARALERTETFFWRFCDQYLELVKPRAYGSAGEGPAASAQAALQEALSVLLRLFAPFLPYATEEVWSWWQDGSVHRSPWPSSDRLRELSGDVRTGVYTAAAEALGEIRKAKTEAKRSLRTEVTAVAVTAPGTWVSALEEALDDVREAGTIIGDVTLTADGSAGPAVEITLAPAEH
jgi:valyl-tRNA synthetase